MDFSQNKEEVEMKQTQSALMAYGIDSASAEKLSKTYTVGQLKNWIWNH